MEYHGPRTAEEVCLLLSRFGSDATVISGGQSLMILLRQRIVNPAHLINLKGVEELNYIRPNGGGVKIGALTTHRAVETSELIKERLPMLAEGISRLGSVQIRNWGTVGGSLCHADPAGDLAPMLIAMDSQVTLVSSSGKRSLPLEEFFLDYYETALKAGEIMAEIEVPASASTIRGAYLKESIRVGDMAIVGVAAALTIEKSSRRCSSARVVVGAVEKTPIRVKAVEEALVGPMLGGDPLRKLCLEAVTNYRPLSDLHFTGDYKRAVMAALMKNAIEKAIG